MSEAAELAMIAFDEAVAIAGNDLAFNGQTARVIASQIRATQRMTDTGYEAIRVCSVEMKRSDFDRMKLTDRKPINIDNEEFRIDSIQRDEADAFVNLALVAQR